MADKEKLIFGIGSAGRKFKSEIASSNTHNKFDAALPNTLYEGGFSQMYRLKASGRYKLVILHAISWNAPFPLSNPTN